MVPDIVRDSPFGHIVRLITRNKVFQYPEERDPSLWKKYVSQEKSGYMAHHGSAEAPEEYSDELRNARGIRERESDEDTQVGDDVNEASGVRVDPEKGKDKHVVDWYGPEDPAVRYHHDLPRSRDESQADNSDIESPQLVALEKVLRHLRNLLPHLLCVHWFRNLHTGAHGCGARVWRRAGTRDTGTYAVCGWVWTWADHLESDERNPSNREAVGVYWDIV
jgi:hypothetical protein